MRRLTPGIWFAALVIVGCRDGEEVRTPLPTPAPVSAPVLRAPAFHEVQPDGEAIFAWLEDERYQETWELLPGTVPLHAGAQPHGTFLTAYANPVAMEALERAAPAMPPGAAIAVEDYLADTTLSTISVMLRFDDPDPESDGWSFAKFAPTGEIAAGPMDACRSCHVLEPDLVFGWELGAPLPIDSTGAAASGGSASGQ